ncbi:MAG: hypothetical protein ACFFG0_34735 [Candidatus Thorarchaeota archaeon]
MVLDIYNKKIHFNENELDTPNDFLNISNLIIPFSTIFIKKSSSDIYSGMEKIPFKERDLKYQKILLYEFDQDQ